MTHSPDRRFWWDGQVWQPAVSADGTMWFDGQRWVPALARPVSHRRVPTEWTRPLQAAVLGTTILGLVVGIPLGYLAIRALPGAMNEAMATSINGQPVGEGTVNAMNQAFTSILTVTLIAAAILTVVWLVLLVLGTLKLWAWIYWVTMVIDLIAIFGAIQYLTYLPRGGLPLTRAGGVMAVIPLPLPLMLAGLAMELVNFGLGVLMLVALVKRGPWGMRRVPAAPSG